MTESSAPRSRSDEEIVETGDQRRSLRIPAILALLIGLAMVAAAVIYLVGNSGNDDEGDFSLDRLDLSASVQITDGDLSEVRLILDPARKGENTADVRFGNTLDSETQRNPGVETVDMTAIRIDAPGDESSASLLLDEQGEFSGARLEFVDEGWWRVTLDLSMSNGNVESVHYVVLIDDPNVNGTDAPPEPEPTDMGIALYNRALSTMTSLSSIHFHETLGSGLGTIVIADRAVSDGSDGNPPTSWLRAPQIEIVTIDGVTWQRPLGEEWYERTPVETFPPSDWGRLYDGATGMREGRTETLRGRPSQIVTFHLPETETLAAAWYVWWVDIETGDVLQEVMVSRLHYMTYEFGGFNEPVIAEPPIPSDASTPENSPIPVATPA